MSSRGFDRDARYSRDEPSGGRTRSQSPTRDRMRDDRGGGYKKDYRDRDYRERDRDLPYGGRERERGTDDRRRERDYEGYSSRYDKPREKAHDRDREREKERENPNSDPNYRPRREDGYDRSRGQSPYPPRGGRGGAYSRGGGRNFAERNPAYGGPGGDKGGRERDYQSMDRRAIEEGRRRREEERAMGVVYNEDGRVYDPREEEREKEEREREQQSEERDADDPEAQIAAMMGFGGFNSTKKKGIGQNVEGDASVHKQRTWRQYMNRRGGFNRPLDKVKD
ncbi:U4/U6.U5 tri-snRNP-associated protein 3 [Cryptococcus neoformans]|uniref:U4/U6.U5 tri-snRNP-associated protein 3 n=1 Tax=Cryptococcus neoformans (strain H99 / ATCC 208821 / CBS 10515 / FGSC 9487) TaxID=235443 RepID=J9VV10_CRYN9|nr:U4/U6.U5 tri-snRNP-associated protein 3 [Cryptococcus neoformans var. grubii H99]AUB26324.1 U4/U6.U5 tri-snRNP-associated protein 3 [Cryptococcus neoformans var. grubii]OWT38491.1 U4/U6.U5 tri-snRNP-associated protein 3 [Cryptococcus neoformans var. grubii Bt1]OWZ30294.1 U4/U6.U5 tri-snRNP-associated protein 3 [Cryptococcus neoformans var. grubii AD2-60a]OWZ42013.1 U4/U6.U5 tri-snRNP-associated protein 3 [Cryptococcus neoformans var. grubii C23]OWZ53037.1 U4/U6.U5 tri-snRNP-associated prote|eukprot:XP_012051081.1 U4/U6.U5 tri-snRNP-associated protein 3 [Cryptococcus neoformans var. grubii H99]